MRYHQSTIMVPSFLIAVVITMIMASCAADPTNNRLGDVLEPHTSSTTDEVILEPEQLEGEESRVVEGGIVTNPHSADTLPTGPGVVIDTAMGGTIHPPANCLQVCAEFNGVPQTCIDDESTCSNRNRNLRRQCNEEMCVPITIPPDPDSLKEITIPAGYVQAELTSEHCLSIASIQVMNGFSVGFFRPSPGARQPLPDGGMSHAPMRRNTDIGQEPTCAPEFKNKAKFKLIQDGETKEYVIKAPQINTFTFFHLLNPRADASAPVFYVLKSVIFAGVTQHRVYDNHRLNRQYDFSTLFNFWFDPQAQATYDVYYKPDLGTAPTGS